MDARTLLVWTIAALFLPLSAAGSSDATSRFEFAITRGSLAQVLEQFSRQSGVQAITQLNVSETTTKELGPFTGRATSNEAMAKLLTGTDLWFNWQDQYTITLFHNSSQRRSWGNLFGTAKDVSDYLGRVIGGKHYDTGSCSELKLGPLDTDKSMNTEEVWIELIRPYCPVIYRRIGNREPGSIIDEAHTAAGKAKYTFSIGDMPRVSAIHHISQQAGGMVIGYISTDEAEERELVGPIQGHMSINNALKKVMRGSRLVTRWVDKETPSIEPAFRMTPYADMSKCPCNFGLPELRPLESDHVTVTESRLPSIEGDIPGRTQVFERNDIEASGASSVPDFLRRATQLAYMRPKGSRVTGAQFAELRGLEPPYTLVLINGVRADVSASDLTASAFDLNNVPISAVERVEISASSPSLVHGMDAIAGLVNIVLRDSVTTPFAAARYGSASGGARERIGTVAAGTSTDYSKTSFFLDYFENTELLGAKRERWRDMDYTRFGGADRRSLFAAPPNVSTLDGQNLPGLDSPDAGLAILPSGETAFRAGELNRTSPLAMQAIVPATNRASLTGSGQIELGRSTLVGEVLLVHRHAHFQMDAEIVPGLVMSPEHPQNPFGVPVAVAAALVGLPPRSTESRSELLRGVLKFNGPMGGDWKYRSFVRLSQETATATHENFVNSAELANGLDTSGNSALNILTRRPGELAGPSLLAPRQSHRAESGGSQFSVRVDGAIPLVDASLTAGIEYRKESARFDQGIGRLSRSEGSAFALLGVPIYRDVRATYGMRVDDFSDLDSIRRNQWGLKWKPWRGVELRAAYNEAFHAPSLYDLYLPQVSTPVPLFDARRQEVTSVNFISGGNPNLSPASGASSALGITLDTANAFTASVDLWRIHLRHHITTLAPLALLANESEAIAGRVRRGTPSELDNQTGRPGRLLSVDLSRANVGEVDTRGIDVSLQKTFETALGTFSPRVDVTYIDAFRYSDLPVKNAPVRDRAGIASVLGTIPPWRGSCSFSYSGYGWGFAISGRYHNSYSDYSVATNTISDREIPGRVLWDLTLSKKFGTHIEITMGVSDLLNREPPFAEVGDPAGFDISQNDLTGRTAFIRLNGSI